MFYVYLLQSLKNKRVYIGYSTNLRVRLEYHNSGKVKSTQFYKPWNLMYYEAYKNKFDATKREKQLKMHASKNELLKRLVNSLVQ